MVKELTNHGIREEELDLPRKESKEMKKEKIFEENEEPQQKVSSYESKKPIKKLTKILIIAGISIFLIACIGLFSWFNLSVSNGKLSPIVNNNMPEVSVPVGVNSTNNNQYNITIQNDIYLSENMSKNIAREIIDTFKNCSGNWTNCTI